jgi:hypothetical protein
MTADVELNEDQNQTTYRTFETGTYMNAMQGILADKRVPMTIREIAKRRIDVFNPGTDSIKPDKDATDPERNAALKLQKLQAAWGGTFYDSSSAFVQYVNEVKFVERCDLLTHAKENQISRGALVIDESQYSSLKERSFKRPELEKLVGRRLNKEEALENPIWKVLLGDTLESYVNLVFEDLQRDKRPAMGMEIRLAALQEGITVRDCYIHGFTHGTSSASQLVCDGDLDKKDAFRVVGRLP